jgi:hypothetical protein
LVFSIFRESNKLKREENISKSKVYTNFAKYILREKDWTVGNLFKLSIICQRAFACGDLLMDTFVSCLGSDGIFAVEWCRLFNDVLLPHLHDSPNTSFAALDSTTAVSDEIVKVRNFTPGRDFLPESTKALLGYGVIESNFHRITSTLCPLVNVLLIPMGISTKDSTKETVLRNEKGLVRNEKSPARRYGVAQYLVPQVNHRPKNPNLAMGLMSDTLMSETPSDHFRAEYTSLPILMVTPTSDFADPLTGSLKNWDTLDDSVLVGGPTALLLGEPEIGSISPFFSFRGEKDDNSSEHSLDVDSISTTAESTRDKFQEATKSLDEPVVKRLLSLGLHTMMKQLLNVHIQKFSSQTDSICGIFSNLCALIKKNTPFLRPFFPYDMSTDSIYPFHHSRVLIGFLTNERVAMVEGNHRSFVSVDALFGSLLVGQATQASRHVQKKLNTGLLLQPAKVSDVLPCIPDRRSQVIDQVVRNCFVLYLFHQIGVFTKHKILFPTGRS